DGTPLTDLDSYRVYYGVATAPCPGPTFFQVPSPTSSPAPDTTVSFRLTGLTTGAQYGVSVSAVDLNGNESACSLVASGVAQAMVSVSPTSTVNFGSVNVGSFADQSFTVQNTRGGTASDNVGVTGVTWSNSRGGSGTAAGTTSWTAGDIALQLGSNVLTVTARDAAGNIGTATLTATLTIAFTFTDDPLVAQSTLVQAAHFVELRAAIDSVRTALGLMPFVWTDAPLTPQGTEVNVVHVTELRTALNQAYQAVGRTAPTYTDPTVAA